jgi:hypothetical protein
VKKSMFALPALALALLVTPPVFAQGEGATPVPDAKSTRPRADVKSEAQKARPAGKIPSAECDYVALDGAKSTRTRTEVRAEADAMRKAGKLPPGECTN